MCEIKQKSTAILSLYYIFHVYIINLSRFIKMSISANLQSYFYERVIFRFAFLLLTPRLYVTSFSKKKLCIQMYVGIIYVEIYIYIGIT